jgi:hypothetical protein
MATKPKTLADFRSVHDDNIVIPARIQAQFAAMLKIGPEEHEYESAFLRAAKVSNNKIGAYRDQFEKYIVTTRDGKRVWFADPKIAAKARGV